MMNVLPGWFPGGALMGGAAAETAFPVVETTNVGGTTGFDTSTTFNVPLPPSIAAGDRLVIFIALASNDGGRTISTPSGWTELYNITVGGNFRRFAAFHKIATGSEGATVAVTASAASQWATNSYRISGAGAGIEAAAPATAGSSTPNPPSLSPSWGAANTLWIAVASDIASTTGTPTAPSGYSSLISHSHVAFTTMIVRTASALLENEAATEDPGAFSIPASGTNAATVVAVQPA